MLGRRNLQNAIVLGAATFLAAPAAFAQTPTGTTPVKTPAADPGLQSAPTPPPAPETPQDSELLKPTPNGLTSEAVAKAAAESSYQAKAAESALAAAAARVDAAWANFLPRLTGKASYTRLSSFTPPDLGNLPILIDPATKQPLADGAPAAGAVVQNYPLVFPLVLDNWSLMASLNVPISDYFFRINQGYTAATKAQEASKYDVATARAKSAADGKVAFYTWLRARGAVTVAEQALDDQRTHLKDANNQFSVGNASKADVLRAETAVASAELQVVQSKNLADLTEKQVRVAMHSKDEEAMAPGESLQGDPQPMQGNAKALENEALSSRLEIKSIDANAASARQQARAARALRYPVITGVGD
ncbi:MAG TPA: TolC family protein, partial [Polyangiaceae bacterium]